MSAESPWSHPTAAPTVLLVDSYDSSRQALATCLRDSNLQVLEARDGVEGLQAVAGTVPAMVIVDFWPFFSAALQMVERLRASPATKQIPVLIVTSTISPRYRERALALGCDGFLEKPCAPEAVLREIYRILSHATAAQVSR